MITNPQSASQSAGGRAGRTQVGRFISGLAVVCAALTASTTWAQALKESAPPEFQRSSATVEAIMTQAVKNIGKRYSLNDIQLRQTDELMKREVRRFLIDHEAEVWPAIRSMISYGMGTKPPSDATEAERFAKDIKPIVELAQKAIFEANNEWREILTDDQKRVHDFDMREMRKTFDHIGSNLDQWESGNPGQQIFPTPRRITSGPKKPVEPPIADTIKSNPVIKTLDPDILTSIVEQFIKEYSLDDGQMNAALSILAEFRTKAKSYQDSKRMEFRQVDREISDAIAARDIKARKSAEQKQRDLLRPFYEITKEMEGRLRGLLTSTQLARYNEINKTTEGDADKNKPDAAKEQDKVPAKKVTNKNSRPAKPVDKKNDGDN